MKKSTVSMISSTKNAAQDDPYRLINLYPELVSSGTIPALTMYPQNRIFALKPAPGSEIVSSPQQPIGGRGGINSLGRSFCVCGAHFYEDVNGTFVSRGTLESTESVCGIIQNGFQILVVDGSKGYVFTLATNVFITLTQEGNGFYGGNGIAAFLTGRALVWFNNPSNTQYPTKWQASDPYDFTVWNGTAYEAVESSFTDLVGIASTNEFAYLFCSDCFEIWQDQQYPIFPYRRYQFGNKIGCLARLSIVVFDSTVFWLGENEGAGAIFSHQIGDVPRIISDAAFQRRFAELADPTSCFAFAYEEFGHKFYCISFYSQNFCYCYDTTLGLWHERYWRNPVNGLLFALPYISFWNYNNKFYFQNYLDGSINQQDSDLFTNCGNSNYMEWTGNCLPQESSKLNYFGSVELQGTVSNTPAGAPDPNCMYQYSPDRGKTWSYEIWRPMGGIGRYDLRILWSGLGAMYTMVPRIGIVAKQKISWRGVEVGIE